MRRQPEKQSNVNAQASEMEAARLCTLAACGILDTAPEPGFDAVVKAASYICQTPISLVSFIDQDRQWFKACVGLEIPSTPRNISFCSHAISRPDDSFVVADTHLDKRFVQHPLVTGDPNIRFMRDFHWSQRTGMRLVLCVSSTRSRGRSVLNTRRFWLVLPSRYPRCSISGQKYGKFENNSRYSLIIKWF